MKLVITSLLVGLLLEVSAAPPKSLETCGTLDNLASPLGTSAGDVTPGLLPWIAGIVLNFGNVAKGNDNFTAVDDGKLATELGFLKTISCSGVLVGQQWVLTVAQCISLATTKDPWPAESLSILVGNQQKFEKEFTGQEILVKEIIIHKEYDPFKVVNDIALVRLAKPIDVSEHVRPICLPETSTPSPMDNVKTPPTGLVSGWILTGKDTNMKASHGSVNAISHDDCERNQQQSNETNSNAVISKDAMFCAEAKQKDDKEWPCYRAGINLVYNEGSADKPRWTLEGILSWGKLFCADTVHVFVKVRHYLPWLKEHMK